MNIPSIRDNPIFYIGILVILEQGIGQGTVSLTNVVPESWVPYIKGWCNLLAFFGTTIMTAVAAPSAFAKTAPPAAKVGALIILGLLLLAPDHAYAQAQSPKIGGPLGHALDKIDEKRAQGVASGNDVKLTGDPVTDLHNAITKGGQKLILHLKESYALAMAKGPSGALADNTSAMCTKALVPIVSLVVNGPPTGTLDPTDPMNLTADEQKMAADTGEPEGPVVKIEKLRILRLALSSPALNDACGALVQDEVKNAQNLVGKITSLITGAGLLGVGIP